MQDAIIIIILLIMMTLGIKETIKHFRGEGSCCGGSSKPPKKKLDNKIIRTYTIKVDGMKCQNCANSVTRAINDIEGASARVNLRKKLAMVSIDRQIDIETIREAIRKRGYEVKK